MEDLEKRHELVSRYKENQNSHNDGTFESLPFILSLICVGIGITFLINYFYGKRFLAKEIEREENNLPEEE